jgi:hypothetical protein
MADANSTAASQRYSIDGETFDQLTAELGGYESIFRIIADAVPSEDAAEEKDALYVASRGLRRLYDDLIKAAEVHHG